jgi:hypothetical protein
MEGIEQQFARVQTPAELEDFMRYHELDEGEKADLRKEWNANNSGVKDRGIIKMFIGYKILKRIFGGGRKRYRSAEKQPWYPGAGGMNCQRDCAPSNAPPAFGFNQNSYQTPQQGGYGYNPQPSGYGYNQQPSGFNPNSYQQPQQHNGFHGY